MKYLTTLIIFIFSITGFSQENKELKKIKCLKKISCNYEKFLKNDTIFILYYKSNVKGLEQNKIDLENYDSNSYIFFNYHNFPLDIYDRQGFEKVNFRKPIEMYKSKSFICKNIERTIDVFYLKNYARKIFNDFYTKSKIIFIIDLDSKLNNKYKIRQVNYPIYIID